MKKQSLDHGSKVKVTFLAAGGWFPMAGASASRGREGLSR
jgi:hypothetical protein